MKRGGGRLKCGLEMLVQICHAADRAAECAKKIEAEGLVVASASGTPRDHPLIRHELAARSFVTKALRALGLNFEALRRSPGRPPASVPVPYGISTEDGGDDVGFEADAR